MRPLILCVLIVLTTGCMSGYRATGPLFSELVESVEEAPSDKSRITLFRTNEYSLYFGRAASIKQNDNEIAQVPKGSFTYLDIEPGSQKIYAETWDYPGICGYNVNAEIGKNYFFEVMPRKESIGKGLLISTGGLIGISIAENMEVIDEKCRGLFAVVPVEKELAMEKIKLLRRAR